MAPYSSWMRCISLMCSATFSMPLSASTRCRCSAAFGSVRLRSCCSSRGYFRMRCIGLMRNDSSVLLCCCLGFRAAKNSCSAWLPSFGCNTFWALLWLAQNDEYSLK
uniref:Putative secreted protein n=1 Tax=Anopheles darlingi TaxID=43151 RepID=A0A2M4CZX9_ANODA